MKIQKTAETKELDRTKFQKFKSAVKNISSKIRKRSLMPVLLTASLFLPTAPKAQEDDQVYKTFTEIITEIDKTHPSLKSYQSLKEIIYIDQERKQNLKNETEKKTIENMSKFIITQKDNQIFKITLNTIIYELFDVKNAEKKYYYTLAPHEDCITLKEDVDSTGKVLVIMSSGNNGIRIMFVDPKKEIKLNLNLDEYSKEKDLDNIMLAVNTFFDDVLPLHKLEKEIGKIPRYLQN